VAVSAALYEGTQDALQQGTPATLPSAASRTCCLAAPYCSRSLRLGDPRREAAVARADRGLGEKPSYASCAPNKHRTEMRRQPVCTAAPFSAPRTPLILLLAARECVCCSRRWRSCRCCARASSPALPP